MKRSSYLTWDQLKVGALILVALVILAIAILKLGQSGNLFGKRYHLVAFVNNVSGLRIGGPVTVAGQLAGSIDDIRFLPPDADTLRNLKIVLQVNQSLQSQVRRDSRAKIKTMGLLGDKVLDITVGTPKNAPLNEGDTVLIAPAVDYEAVVSQASGVITEVAGVTRQLQRVADQINRGEGTLGQLLTNRTLYDQLNSTLLRTSALMARLENPRGTIGRLLDDPALYYSLNRAVASADSMISAMNRSNGTFGRLLRDDALYMRMVSVVARADSLVSVMSGGNGTMQKLFTDQQLYDQLIKVVGELNNVLIDVRRDPRRYTKEMIRVKLF
ncbi:MAG TPA: MlaD family protein [Gemmatimonadaceae bacterium]|nr:MlaD family protein [Gemmatimonadaceae bacterium]